MKCSVYIATTADGYIAISDGGVDWLHTAGNLQADMGSEDMGFKSFMDSVDCMIMGRKCMEMISSFDLTPEQGPYGDVRIVVLSNIIKEPPENLKDKVEMYSVDIYELIKSLESEGCQHAFVDGGTTITSFIDLKLINEMIIMKAPILLGVGIPLCGEFNQRVKLTNSKAVAFPNDFTQIRYTLDYS
jgi:dihydrofolate reductase